MVASKIYPIKPNRLATSVRPFVKRYLVDGQVGFQMDRTTRRENITFSIRSARLAPVDRRPVVGDRPLTRKRRQTHCGGGDFGGRTSRAGKPGTRAT
jgi:hypothetical protein